MSYISSILMGGIGNNLFQIAAGYALGLKYERNFICSFLDIHSTHNSIFSYTDNIFRNVLFTKENLYFNTYTEISHEYREINIPSQLSIKLYGYFQSEKYFINYKPQIQKLFEVDITTLNKLFSKYKHLIEDNNTCSVHVRRGDYIKLAEHHPLQPMSYYSSAFTHFNDKTKFVFFSDDINWCKDNFKINNKTFYIENNTDYEDLYLMSMCKNNIIANSSFSWWGAWLNPNVNKKIIAPQPWFGPAFKDKNTKDIYCKNWIIV